MWTVHQAVWPMGLTCHLSWCRTTHMEGYPMGSKPWACTHRISLYLQVSAWHILIIFTFFSNTMTRWFRIPRAILGFFFFFYIICFSTGGPGLEPPYRPARNPQMNKMMPTRPSYPGIMPGMQGNMPGMMGLDKQYPMGYKPQPSMPQGQILRQQLQVRLVSQSVLTGQATLYNRFSVWLLLKLGL